MVSIMWRVYQRCGKWLGYSAFEFSDTTASWAEGTAINFRLNSTEVQNIEDA
jgi:hypothetical protein